MNRKESCWWSGVLYFSILFLPGLLPLTSCSLQPVEDNQPQATEKNNLPQTAAAGIDVTGVIETVRHHIKPDMQDNDRLAVESQLYKAEFAADGFHLSLRKKLTPQELTAMTKKWRESVTITDGHKSDRTASKEKQRFSLPVEAIGFDNSAHFTIATQAIRYGTNKLAISSSSWRSEYNTALRELAPGITERVTAREGEVEWDFILPNKLPGHGALRIEANVKGGGKATTIDKQKSSLSWSLANGRQMHMGQLRVIDAGGKEIYSALPRAVNNKVMLDIPESVLASARYPVTIDPIISPEYPVAEPVTGMIDPGNQIQPTIAFDGTNYLVVWQDRTSTDGPASDIYGTRVSPSGTVLDGSGIAIATTANYEEYPAVAWSGTNYLIVWQEATDVYGVRMNSSGTILDLSPITVSTATGYQTTPQVAADGVNFIVVWADGRSGTSTDIYGARVRALDGLVFDGPPSTGGIAISTATYDQRAAAVSWDGTNYLVAWQDNRSCPEYYCLDIYAARVSNTGTLLDGPADTGGIPVSTAVEIQRYPSVTSDGSNSLVVWGDNRNESTSSYDIYGARVSNAGALLDGPSDTGGIPISTATLVQNLPFTAWDGTNYLVVWSDGRNLSTNEYDIYGARISTAGVLLDGPADTGGIAISTALYKQTTPALTWGNTSYLVVWTDLRAYYPGFTNENIIGSRIDVTGTVLDGPPDSGGIAITQGVNEQYESDIAWDGNNYLVVWADNRNGYQNIFGARIDTMGTILDGGGFSISAATNHALLPAITWSGTNYIVAWTQATTSAIDHDIYATRISTLGTVLDNPPIAVSTASSYQYSPAVASNGGDFLVAWKDARDYSSSGHQVYAARISAAGVLLDGPPATGGIVVASMGTQSFYDPGVAWDGNNYLVVWEDWRNWATTELDIYGARVSSSGTLLDPSGIAISNEANWQYNPSVASNGKDFFVAWMDERGPAGIYGARVSLGAVLDPAGIAISTHSGAQANPAIAPNGANYLVVWQDGRNPTSGLDIYGARVNASGTLLDGSPDFAGFDIAASLEADIAPSVISSLSTAAVSFQRLASETPYDGAQRVFLHLLDYNYPTADIDDVIVTEGDAGTVSAIFTVSLSSPGEINEVTVDYTTADGTASAGSDYVATSGTVTFTGGNTTETITVEVSGDTFPEPNESFFVNLSNPGGALIGDHQGIGTISNDDGTPPAISIDDVVVVEGDSGVGAAIFTVTLNTAGSQEISVDYTTTDGSAVSASDYIAATGTLVFPAGSTTQYITILINGDTYAEPDENFFVDLSNPTNATIADGQGTGTINNDDGAVPTLSIGDVTVTEGDVGTVNAVFTVSLSPVSGLEVTTNYMTADDTATSASDYLATTGTLVFPPGSSMQTVSVQVNGDTLFELDESFFVNLMTAYNATISDAQGVGTISNDDPIPALSIDDVQVSEGDSGTVNADFVVSLTNPSAFEISVDYATADGSATSAADYVAASANLTFPAGTTTQTISVVVNGDTYIEPSESFFVNLTNPSGATISQAQGTGTISNDDEAILAFDPVASYLLTGSQPVALISADLDNDSDFDISVADWNNNVWVLLNNGDATYATPVKHDPAVGISVESVSAADLDGDSDVDIAFAGWAGWEEISYLPNNGDGTFAAAELVYFGLSGTQLDFIVTEDLDNDGDKDIAVADYLNGLLVALNNGDGTFAPMAFYSAGGREIAAVDINDDSYIDLLITRGAQVEVMLNDGDGTFTAAAPIITGNNPYSIVAVDLDGDMDFDIAVTDLNGDNLVVMRNNGDGTFTSVTTITGINAPYAVRAGDMDLDGDMDLVTANAGDENVLILLNQGDATFPSSLAISVTDNPRDVTINDLDGDGDPDIAVARKNSANVTILLNRLLQTTTVAFSSAVSSFAEDAGTATIEVTVTSSDGEPIVNPLIVDYDTADGSASGGIDYTTTAGVLTFAAGTASGSTQTINVPITDDLLDEDDETFTLNLANPGGASLGTPAIHTVTILDDDPLPSISINDVGVAEGHSGTTSAVFTVSLSVASGRAVSVDYLTVDGTATAGSDYIAASGTITIPAGTTLQPLPVAVVGDLIDEPDETFSVFLTNPSNATITDSQGIGTIFNDDTDTDSDGAPDNVDNCTLVPNGPVIPDAGGHSQRDTDIDGYGNVCDPDFNNDLIINATDLFYLKSKFFTSDADADLNGDGVVNATDLFILKQMFFQPPGPSCCAP